MSWRDLRQASVIEEVPFGFMRSMLMTFVDVPVTDGSEMDSVISGVEKGSFANNQFDNPIDLTRNTTRYDQLEACSLRG